MLSGIPQVAQIGPSLVAKNGTPFCLFTAVECPGENTANEWLESVNDEQYRMLR